MSATQKNMKINFHRRIIDCLLLISTHPIWHEIPFGWKGRNWGKWDKLLLRIVLPRQGRVDGMPRGLIDPATGFAVYTTAIRLGLQVEPFLLCSFNIDL